MDEFMWWVPVFAGALIVGVGLLRGATAARRRSHVDALIVRLEIPESEHIVALIDRRVRDEIVWSGFGGLLALPVVIWPLMVPDSSPSDLFASAAPGLVLAAGIALGSAVAALRQFSPQAGGEVRIARAVTPRLDDYVHPAWTWSVSAVTLLAVSGCAVLFSPLGEGFGSTADLPRLGVLGATVLALVVFAGVALLGRRLMAIPQPAGNELELRWDDALRGLALRSLWLTSLTVSWAACLLSSALLFEIPAAYYFVAWLLAFAPIFLLSLPASRRTEWYLWPDASNAVTADEVSASAP